MNIFALILTTLGLALFEIINSVDNAIVNADVLATMQPKARRWFLVWGLIVAVFLIRGLLPFIIVKIASPAASFKQIFTSDLASSALHHSAPNLLIAGGVFLVFVFLHWLFMEPKEFGIWGERFFLKKSVWFYAVVSIILSGLVWVALKISSHLGFSVVLGSTVFFIVNGFKQNAALSEQMMRNSRMSDISKLMYLEMLDATFSIDSVLGAFAFTFFIPLILIGNGLGSVILRELTIKGVDKIKNYKFLKNGAMYSILSLGIIMILESFGAKVASWVSPVITFLLVGFFYFKSVKSPSL